MTVADLRAGARPGFDLASEALAPLPLPPARAAWRVPAGAIASATRLTPGDIEDLLGCPLPWVLGRAASLHSYSVPSLRDGPALNGGLGHRLIEALVAHGDLVQPRAALAEAIDELVPGVAAWLLQPGRPPSCTSYGTSSSARSRRWTSLTRASPPMPWPVGPAPLIELGDRTPAVSPMS